MGSFIMEVLPLIYVLSDEMKTDGTTHYDPDEPPLTEWAPPAESVEEFQEEAGGSEENQPLA